MYPIFLCFFSPFPSFLFFLSDSSYMSDLSEKSDFRFFPLHAPTMIFQHTFRPNYTTPIPVFQTPFLSAIRLGRFPLVVSAFLSLTSYLFSKRCKKQD